MKFIRKATAVLLSALLCAMAVIIPPDKAPTLMRELSSALQGNSLVASADGITYNIHYWLTDSVTDKMGEVTNYAYKGVRYYVCYEMTNADTGELMTDTAYTVSLTLTDRTGTELASAEYDSQKSYTWTVGENKYTYTGAALFLPVTPQNTGDLNLHLVTTGDVIFDINYSFYISYPYVNLHVWITDKEYGDVADEFVSGNKYYICSEITDMNLNKRLNSKVSGYTSTIRIYEPSDDLFGELSLDETDTRRVYRCSHFTPKTPGRWRATVTLEGDIELEVEISWTVTESGSTVSSTQTSTTVTGSSPTTTSKVTTSQITSSLSFEWGKDNWSFGNNNSSFPDGYAVDESIINDLCKEFSLTNIEKEIMKYECSRSQYVPWGGSCFGMTASEILVKLGVLDLSKFSGSKTVNDNTNSKAMQSLINFMQNFQSIPFYARQMRLNFLLDVPGTLSQPDYIKKIVDVIVNDGSLVSLGYVIRTNDLTAKSYSFGGHAVLAYGVEKCNYTDDMTGLTYDRRILIADPNYLHANKVTDKSCLYYRSSDYSWVIPYWNCSYTSNSHECTDRCYWNAGDSYYANGYIRRIVKFTSKTKVDDLAINCPTSQYLPGIKVYHDENVSAPEFIQVPNTGIKEHDSIMGISGIFSYFDEASPSANQTSDSKSFTNDTANYEFKYNTPQNFDFIMDYEKFAYISEVENGTYAVFEPNGFVGIKGSNMNYKMSMVANNSVKNLTDWYTVRVEGSGASAASLSALKGRYYVLEADNLKNIHVTAYNDEATATVTFSTTYKKVSLEEKNPTTIVVKVDTDDDGVFDKIIATSNEQPPVTTTTTTTITTTTTTTTKPVSTTSTTTKKTSSTSTTSTTTSSTTTVTTTGTQPVVSGKCGVNASWNYDQKNATLTISGTGAMENYSALTGQPWRTYAFKIQKVIVKEGITALGDYSLDYLPNCISIQLPDSLTTVGKFSLSTCEKVSTITFSENVTEIANNALASNPTTNYIFKNPKCNFYKYAFGSSTDKYTGTVYGYTDSTAQKYAEEHGINFIALDGQVTLGDVDGNGLINAIDASKILVLCAVLSDNGTATERDFALCDVNNDGRITAVDASYLLSYCANLANDPDLKLADYVASRNK